MIIERETLISSCSERVQPIYHQVPTVESF
jgi:hypothetical protein